MANHQSSIKRVRQSQNKKLKNKYFSKTTKSAMKNLRNITDKTQAIDLYRKVSSMLDKLAKKNIVHKNNANNLKSKLALHIQKLK